MPIVWTLLYMPSTRVQEGPSSFVMVKGRWNVNSLSLPLENIVAPPQAKVRRRLRMQMLARVVQPPQPTAAILEIWARLQDHRQNLGDRQEHLVAGKLNPYPSRIPLNLDPLLQETSTVSSFLEAKMTSDGILQRMIRKSRWNGTPITRQLVSHFRHCAQLTDIFRSRCSRKVSVSERRVRNRPQSRKQSMLTSLRKRTRV